MVRFEIQTESCPFQISPMQGTLLYKIQFYLSLFIIIGVLAAKQKQEISISFSPEEAKVVIATAVIKFSICEEGTKVLKMSAIGKYPFVTINQERFDFETLLVGKVDTREVILKN